MGGVKNVVKPPDDALKLSVNAGYMECDKMVSEAMCRWFESNRAHHIICVFQSLVSHKKKPGFFYYTMNFINSLTLF